MMIPPLVGISFEFDYEEIKGHLYEIRTQLFAEERWT